MNCFDDVRSLLANSVGHYSQSPYCHTIFKAKKPRNCAYMLLSYENKALIAFLFYSVLNLISCIVTFSSKWVCEPQRLKWPLSSIYAPFNPRAQDICKPRKANVTIMAMSSFDVLPSVIFLFFAHLHVINKPKTVSLPMRYNIV